MADQRDEQAAYPPYVVSEDDRTRWKNAESVARKALGTDATAAEVWQLHRTIYHDRETYPS